MSSYAPNEESSIVIDLKRDATPEVVLNQLWRHTPAQSSFPANMLAIRGGRPETLALRDIIESFVKFREEVITRRSKFELLKARERAHILLGLVVAVTNLDEVVKLIRGSASPAEAREKLLAREWPGDQIRPYIALVEAVEPQKAGESYRLSEAQVRAILELRLHRLTALGRDEIGEELEGLARNIGELLEILSNRARLYEVMRYWDDDHPEWTPEERDFAAAWRSQPRYPRAAHGRARPSGAPLRAQTPCETPPGALASRANHSETRHLPERSPECRRRSRGYRCAGSRCRERRSRAPRSKSSRTIRAGS